MDDSPFKTRKGQVIDGTARFKKPIALGRCAAFVRYKRRHLRDQGFNVTDPDEPLPSLALGPRVPIADRRRSPPASTEEP